jgi:glutamyl-tRNA synthetase
VRPSGLHNFVPQLPQFAKGKPLGGPRQGPSAARVNFGTMSVRVRFAPSPTGSLHLGALRDALFKHLFARHHGGVNVVRIEDTDRSRYSETSEGEIMESLRWVGIEWQEGPDKGGPHAPYRQSDRKQQGIYAELVDRLVTEGKAYRAYDSPEELERMREEQQAAKEAIGYFGGTWRDAPQDQRREAEAAGRSHVVRLKIPRGQTIAIDDAIRGRIEWDSDTVDDPVLLKADGMPTYHCAAMVDDHLMGITHIIRGEEWISSAPKHAVLFDAFGWERPVFVHCPVIKGKDGKKLSKRHGDTSVLQYRAAGYLPEALVNFVALIGWSPGHDQEIMSEAQLAEAFDLDGLQPSPGLFDIDKLKWMNGVYIRERDPVELCRLLGEYLERDETIRYWEQREPEAGEADPREVAGTLVLLRDALRQDPEYVRSAVELLRERVQTLADFGPGAAFFFQEQPPMDERAVAKWFAADHVRGLFDHLVARLGTGSEATVEACEATVREHAESLGLEKLGPVVHPTRVALTGKTAGPGLFELMSVLGPERMRKRFERSMELLP